MQALATASALLRRMVGGRSRSSASRFRFLATSLPLDEFRVVLDVGANVGKTASRYLRHFPNAKVWAFEPVPATCEVLRARFAQEPRVEIHQVALGAVQSVAPMVITPDSVGCSIVERIYPGQQYEQVTVTTGDAFLEKAGLPGVDFLKIDTEGHDLHVLEGFSAALQSKAIRFLQVEAGLNCTNLRHVPIQQFMQFLAPFDYHLYRIINQVREFDGRPMLRRADLVFHRAA